MAVTKNNKAPRGATRKATKRVERVSAKKPTGASKARAVKRTIKKRPKPGGPAARIKPVKPTAEHPLPEPIATFTF